MSAKNNTSKITGQKICTVFAKVMFVTQAIDATTSKYEKSKENHFLTLDT